MQGYHQDNSSDKSKQISHQPNIKRHNQKKRGIVLTHYQQEDKSYSLIKSIIKSINLNKFPSAKQQLDKIVNQQMRTIFDELVTNFKKLKQSQESLQQKIKKINSNYPCSYYSSHDSYRYNKDQVILIQSIYKIIVHQLVEENYQLALQNFQGSTLKDNHQILKLIELNYLYTQYFNYKINQTHPSFQRICLKNEKTISLKGKIQQLIKQDENLLKCLQQVHEYNNNNPKYIENANKLNQSLKYSLNLIRSKFIKLKQRQDQSNDRIKEILKDLKIKEQNMDIMQIQQNFNNLHSYIQILKNYCQQCQIYQHNQSELIRLIQESKLVEFRQINNIQTAELISRGISALINKFNNLKSEHILITQQFEKQNQRIGQLIYSTGINSFVKNEKIPQRKRNNELDQVGNKYGDIVQLIRKKNWDLLLKYMRDVIEAFKQICKDRDQKYPISINPQYQDLKIECQNKCKQTIINLFKEFKVQDEQNEIFQQFLTKFKEKIQSFIRNQEIKDQKSSFEIKRNNKNVKLDSFISQVNQPISQIKLLQEQILKKTHEIEILTKEKQTLKLQNQGLMSELAIVKTNFEKNQQENNKLQIKINILQSKIKDIEEVKKKKQQILNNNVSQKIKIKSYEKIINQKDTIILDLQKKMKQLENKIKQNQILQKQIRFALAQNKNKNKKIIKNQEHLLIPNEKERKYLTEIIEKEINKKITKTKLVYRRDPLNQRDIHDYIDKIPHLILLIEVANGFVLGAYTQAPFTLKSKTEGMKGLLFSLTNQKYFKLSSQTHPPILYDQFYIIFGNSDLRIKRVQTYVYSNFGSYNSFFQNKGETINILFGQGDRKREAPIKNYEFFRIIFEQESKQ